MDPCEVVKVGLTDARVTRLGVGFAALIGQAGTVDDDAADAIVRCAHLLGIRYADVAPLYGLGRSEAALRRGAAARGAGSVAVSTKAGRLLQPRTLRNRVRVRLRELRYSDRRWLLLWEYVGMTSGRARGLMSLGSVSPDPESPPGPTVTPSSVVPVRDFTAEGVRLSALESLARLGRDRVEILLLHDPDGLRGTQLDTAWAPLVELRDAGLVDAIGISSNDSIALSRMVDRLDPDVVMLAGRYTLMDQSALDDLLPLAQRRGVSVVLGGVFNGGLLADPEHAPRFDYRPARRDQRERAVRIASIATRHGVPIVAAAIQFGAAHPAVSSIVVGVRSAEELAEDVALAQFPIPTSFWEDLAGQGLLRRDAPVPPASERSLAIAG